MKPLEHYQRAKLNAIGNARSAKLIAPPGLDRIRRRRHKTLDDIASEVGFGRCLVWRVVRGRCFDLRRIVPVCRALGVSLRRLDLEGFLGETKDSGRGDERNHRQPSQDPSDQGGG